MEILPCQCDFPEKIELICNKCHGRREVFSRPQELRALDKFKIIKIVNDYMGVFASLEQKDGIADTIFQTFGVPSEKITQQDVECLRSATKALAEERHSKDFMDPKMKLLEKLRRLAVPSEGEGNEKDNQLV